MHLSKNIKPKIIGEKSNVFHIFANLLHIQFIRLQLYSQEYIHFHLICYNILFWLKYVEKIQFHTKLLLAKGRVF